MRKKKKKKKEMDISNTAGKKLDVFLPLKADNGSAVFFSSYGIKLLL